MGFSGAQFPQPMGCPFPTGATARRSRFLVVGPRCAKNKGGPENPKAKRQQTNLSNTDNWFISFSPLASFFLENEHYGRIHCKFHFSPPAR